MSTEQSKAIKPAQLAKSAYASVGQPRDQAVDCMNQVHAILDLLFSTVVNGDETELCGGTVAASLSCAMCRVGEAINILNAIDTKEVSHAV